MTPKRKAKEIFDECLKLTSLESSEESADRLAKRMALVVIREAEKQSEVTDKIYKGTVWYSLDDGDVNLYSVYWGKVKEELEKIK